MKKFMLALALLLCACGFSACAFVSKPTPKHLSFAVSGLSLQVGDTHALKVKLNDEVVIPDRLYLSDSPDSASVSLDNGVLTAIRKGNTAVYAEYRKLTAQLSVTVSKRPALSENEIEDVLVLTRFEEGMTLGQVERKGFDGEGSGEQTRPNFNWVYPDSPVWEGFSSQEAVFNENSETYEPSRKYLRVLALAGLKTNESTDDSFATVEFGEIRTLSEVSLPEGLAWAQPGEILRKGRAPYACSFENKIFYLYVSAVVQMKIPDILTPPTILLTEGPVEGGDLPALKGGEASTAGIFRWEENQFLLPGGNLYSYEFVPTDSERYSVVTGSYYIHAQAATPGLVFSGNTVSYSGDGSELTGELIVPKRSPDGRLITKIANLAFENANISTAYLPGIEEVGNLAFAKCAKLNEVYLPNAQTLGSGAFGHTALASVNLPSVTTLSNQVFWMCKSLREISMPKLVMVDRGCFEGTPWLADQSKPLVVNGLLLFYPGATGDVVLGEEIVGIGAEVFKNNRNITSVSMPNAVRIGKESFSGCSNLKRADMPKVEQIEWRAFADCGLETVDLPAIDELQDFVFDACGSLTDVNLGSLRVFDRSAFWNCDKLVAFRVDALNPYLTSVDGVVFSKNLAVLKLYPNAKSDETLRLPDATQKIDPGVLDAISLRRLDINNAIFLSSIFLNDNCRALEGIFCSEDNPVFSSFEGVLYSKDISALVYYPRGKQNKRFVLPETCLTVEAEAVSNNEYLNAVSGAQVASIGNYAFFECTNLQSADFPNLAAGGISAFDTCNLSSVSFPKLVRAESSFLRCNYNLTSVNLPALEQTEGGLFMYSALSGFAELSKKTHTVGNYEYYHNLNLVTVELPNRYDSIRNNAFAACDNLETFVIRRADSIVQIGPSVFDDENHQPLAKLKIYVPDALVNAYKAAEPWAKYAALIVPLSEYDAM